MDHELVHIHLGHHRIQVHKGPLAGDAHGQDGPDLGFRTAEHVPCQLLNGLRHGPLGDAHCQDGLRQVHHVAALQGVGRVRRVVERRSGILRMMLQDIRAIQGFPAAGSGIHPVQCHAAAYRGEGIPGEIEVWNGLQSEISLAVEHGGQGFRMVQSQVGEGNAGHGLQDHFVYVFDGAQVCLKLPLIPVGDASAFLSEVPDERLLKSFVLRQRLGGELGEVHHFHTVVPEHLGKAVVLRLCTLQIGDVVKKQPLQGTGDQMLQLLAGPVQQHTAKGGNFTVDLNWHMKTPLDGFGITEPGSAWPGGGPECVAFRCIQSCSPRPLPCQAWPGSDPAGLPWRTARRPERCGRSRCRFRPDRHRCPFPCSKGRPRWYC